MKRHKPHNWQGAPSAAKLPRWGNENHELVLAEGIVSIHSHKGSSITRFIIYRSQKWGSRGRQ